MYMAAVLLLAFCFSLTACGKRSADTGEPGTTGQPSEPTVTGTSGAEGTEATQPAAGSDGDETDSNKPTLESDTQVGSGRVEGGSGSQQPTTQEPTKPSNSETVPGETAPNDGLTMNYQQYMALSSAEQQNLYDKYFSDDPLAFANWFQRIKAEYDAGREEIIATGPVDLEDYLNP